MSELREAVRAAANYYDEQIEQIYLDSVDVLANKYGVEEEDVIEIWEEVAP
ncbi:MAG: hypothetical protein LC687_05745 [Actinobacteria bacterium]|nr:hypothetical protein [Actinomycetota bacterium]